jgi:hypothetical protein
MGGETKQFQVATSLVIGLDARLARQEFSDSVESGRWF